MNTLARNVTGLTACGILFAAVAMAVPPDVPRSTYPSGPLRLVGFNATTIDPAGLYMVRAVDVNDNPVPGIEVSIRLANCVDTQIATQDYQHGGTGGKICAACPYPLTVDAANIVVTTLTNASGVAGFDLVGAINAGSPPTRVPVVFDAPKPGCAVTRCGEIWFPEFNLKLANIQVVAFDQNGANGVDGVDLAYWAFDFFPNSYGGEVRSASNYNGSNCVDPIDLSLWAVVYFSGNSVASSPTYVPRWY